MTVDVLFLAWNRRLFTEVSFAALIANTDWSLVRRLVVVDDASTDGTTELLRAAAAAAPVPVTFRRSTRTGGPVSSMLRYLGSSNDSDVFAKIDNDVLVPPGWLPTMLSVLDAEPAVELLGMEAGMTAVAGRDVDPWDGRYSFWPATHVGGVGVFRTEAFRSRPSLVANGRFGFTEWQHIYKPVRGWVTPDLPVPLLDRMPTEPWKTLSDEYRANGWERPWPRYDERMMEWAWEWFDGFEWFSWDLPIGQEAT